MSGRVQQQSRRGQIELAKSVSGGGIAEAGRIGQTDLANEEIVGVQEKIHSIITEQTVAQFHAGCGAALLSARCVRVTVLRMCGVGIQVGGLVQLAASVGAAIEQSAAVT